MGERLRKFLAFVAKQDGISLRFPFVSLDPSKLAKRASLAAGTARLTVFPTASIELPGSGSAVSHAVEVCGTVSQMPEGQQLWLAVVPDGGALHPCRGPVHVHGDRWSGVAYVGTRTPGASEGDQFQLRLILLPETEALKWHEYLDEAARDNSWCGIPVGDYRVLAWVNVYRHDRRAQQNRT